jgi:hypothetical protein
MYDFLLWCLLCSLLLSSRFMSAKDYCIYSNARRDFSINLGLKSLRSSKICVWSAKLDRRELDHAKAKPRPALPNHHVRSSLFWDSMHWSGNSVPTFQDNLSFQSSRVKKSKRELCSLSNFLKKHDVLEAGSVSIYRHITSKLVDLLGWAI